MKKALIVLAALFCGICANAQWYVGGTLQYNTGIHSYDGRSNTSYGLGLAPEAGYKFNDKFSVGASLNLSSSFDDHIGISISPYVRWTFFNMDFFHIFLDGVIAYEHSAYKMNENLTSRSNGWSIGVLPGFAFDLTSKWSLAMHIGGLSFSQDFTQDVPKAKPQNNLNFGINGASIGCYYSF